MSTSMLKFFQDRGGAEHGGDLHWPGTLDGFPFRGPGVPDLKQHEAVDIPLALDYKSRLFELWDPAQKAEFDKTMDRIVNGWYMQHKRRDKDIEGQSMPAVWLEWVQIYGEVPETKVPRSIYAQPADQQSVNRPAAQTGDAAQQHDIAQFAQDVLGPLL